MRSVRIPAVLVVTGAAGFFSLGQTLGKHRAALRDLNRTAAEHIVSMSDPALAPEEHVVEMRDLAFADAVVRAAPGDTIRWVNRDIVSHTVTADDGSFDSGEVPPGGEFVWVVEGDGPISYICLYHPTMTGRVEVSGGA